MPTSTVVLYEQIPLRIDYTDTILFANAAVRNSFFNSKTKYSYNNYSYVKRDGLTGVIRVGAQIGNIYKCNYLVFKNVNSTSTAYENIDTFCFITKVEYASDNTTLVYFTVDVMQTWLFTATLDPCYVERQHTPTDEIGQDAGAEDIPCNEYIINSAQTSGKMGGLKIMVVSTFEPVNLQPYYGGYYAGIYSGLCCTVFSTAAALNTWLATVEAANKIDGIVNICMLPDGFVPTGQVPESTLPINYTVEIDKNQTLIDGYAPKNKRLFSWPYNKLCVSNLQGSENEYRFEMFGFDPLQSQTATKAYFRLAGNCTADPEIICAPLNYRGDNVYNGNTSTTTNIGYNHYISIRGFPQCAWNADVYKIWLGNRKVQAWQDLLNSIPTFISTVALPESSAGGGGNEALVGGVIGSIFSTIKAQRQPAQAHGGQASSILASLDMLDFVFSTKTIRAAQAKIIDDYFSMYGYAIKRCQVPNRNARPHWTYVKTIGCHVEGNIPADANMEICKIYDRGIRFWNNATEINNYSLDNSPVTTT